MGIFDFFKSAGTKAKENEAPKSEDLATALKNFKIGADNVQVKIDGDKATLSGEVKDQTALEKTIMAVGNYFGIGKVDTGDIKVIATADAREPEFYEVKKGDTLSKIAEEVYGKGNANKYNMIFEANRPMLTHPDKIYPGQRLIIPPLTTAA